MQSKLFPLVGWTQAAGAAAAATPAIDISNLPAGMGGEPAFVEAFIIELTMPNNGGGACAATTYQQQALQIPSIGLSSQIYGDLFGGGGGVLTGTDIYNWVQPMMGWGPIGPGCGWPYPNGIAANANAVTRTIKLILPFRNKRLAQGAESDGSLPTVGFRGDSIQMTLAATGVLGANYTLGTVVCTPWAVITTRKERRAPTVRHWGQMTSANAEIVLPGRAYDHVALMSNLVGLQGSGAISAYTGIQIARDDLAVGLAMTPEALCTKYFSEAHSDTVEGIKTIAGAVAGSLAWPFAPNAAVAVTGVCNDPQLLGLPLIYAKGGTKHSHVSLNQARLSIQTAGVAGTHRVLYSALAPQSEAFLSRMAGLYGMSEVTARPKLLKPPRDAASGVKKSKTSVLPFTLFDRGK